MKALLLDSIHFLIDTLREVLGFLREVIIPVLILLAVISVPIVGLVFLVTYESKTEAVATYRAWTSATGKTNLTFEDWSRLRSKNLLPGQPAQPAHVPVIIPMPTQ